MKRFVLLPIFIFATLLAATDVLAEQHRATRLGNPATRFAPTIFNVEDLRGRFRDEKLRPDFAAVLSQWGWQGNLEDLFHAAQTNEVVEWPIAVGTTMPFMSSRENGKAICLRNVLWAGQEPAPAYAFIFASNGRRYRCITPKACSNFFVEDLGPEPKPGLALACDAPAEVIAGRPIKVCLTVSNPGNAPEPKVTVTLPTPKGASVVRTTENGITTGETTTWEVANLAANSSRQLCATLAMRELGVMDFSPAASGSVTKPVTSACSTKIIGVPAILLEVVDLEDPVEVGKEVVYEIRVTNQGTALGTNVRLVCTLPGSQEFVAGSGATSVSAAGQTVKMAVLPTLAAKAVATWRVTVKAIQADDVRFKAEVSSDQFERPVWEDESTHQY